LDVINEKESPVDRPQSLFRIMEGGLTHLNAHFEQGQGHASHFVVDTKAVAQAPPRLALFR
jgi:hypothetical protein